MKRSCNVVHVFEFVFEHIEDILNTDFINVWCLHTRTHWPSRLRGYCSGHLMLWGDLTKPIITNSDVDRIYWNLVICLQLGVALLTLNFVKIRHCLTELWKCIQRVTFSRAQCTCTLFLHSFINWNCWFNSHLDKKPIICFIYTDPCLFLQSENLKEISNKHQLPWFMHSCCNSDRA